MSAKPSCSNSASAARSEASKGASMVKPASASLTPTDILSVIESLKKKVEANRLTDVKSRIEENKQKLMNVTVSKESNNTLLNKTGRNSDLLMKRQSDAVEMQKGIDINNMDKDSSDSQDDGVAPSAVLLGASIPVKSGVRPIRLPEVKTLPSYTTWIFLNRNQRMTEDQSVVGRRRIYYDPNGGEALICSDSEEEVIEEEEEKKEFAESEDYILRMTIQELGSSDTVLDVLGQCFSRKPCDVKARYEVLCKAEFDAKALTYGNNEASSQSPNPYIDKDLEAALDSFDNLFCRRCYVFDCRLHGCSQDLVFPAEKPHPWNHSDEKPCGPHCYRSPMKSESYITASSQGCDNSKEKPDPSCDVGPTRRKKSFGSSVRWKEKSNPTESASSNVRNASESSDSDVRSRDDDNSVDQSSSRSKPAGKPGNRKKKNKRLPEKIIISKQKRQKKMVTSDPKSVSREMRLRSHSRKDDEDASSSLKKVNSTNEERSKKKESPVLRSSKSLSDEVIDNPPEKAANVRKELVDESRVKQEANDDKSWKALEKGLFEKGLEIFGRNSCLISRNLLNGLKTCREVYQYMTGSENKLFSQGGDSATKADCDEMGNDMRGRSRYVRRRGRVRRLKYTWKSTAYHSIRKRISERKDLPCRQYNPCGCQTACGKQCPCILNGSCCEKYCGCPKTCKNRFRGCHCAKSQCRSRQCPCFAADRECDPDVCRNCWVSCGDGTLGVPSQRGDNYECRNMKLLLKQQQRVLLGRSDVSGWGAFLKNSVGKHEYLGEYTGELISHREADKRGKIYDRENSSFLFNLNDQFVLDAYRKGDKLKFANHSPDPNCYAKVIMVAGDHRVGIFAKERMNSGEELFYDYRYEPDRAPAWARRPEASGSKKDDAGPSTGRAKKLA